MYFYKEGSNWILGESIIDFIPSGTYKLKPVSGNIVHLMSLTPDQENILNLNVTKVKKNSNGDFYTNITDFTGVVKDFFVNAAQEAADQLAVRVQTLEDHAYDTLWLDYWQVGLPALSAGKFWYDTVHSIYYCDGAFWLEIYGDYTLSLSQVKIYINRVTGIPYGWSGTAMVALASLLTFATQAEAEAGTENSKIMTALRVVQSIAYQLINLDFSGLSTTSKKIVGAVNELFTNKAEKSDVRVYRGDSTGTADAISVTVSPTLITLTDKDIFLIKVLYPNATTTSTINISGKGAKTIVKKSGNALAIGDIQAGYYKFVYDGNIDKFHLMTPSMEDVNFATMLHSASLKSIVVDGDETAGNDSANSYGLTKWTWSSVWNYMINKPIRTIAISAYDIDLSTGEDFSKTCGASSAFTISNPIIKKKFRLFLTGGTLAVPTFTGYTTTWMASTAVTDYVPANTNVLYCEIRSAGTINLFWGE